MINRPSVVAMLKQHYPVLEEVSDIVLRGIDLYDGRPYAVRYFDLSDDIVSIAPRLREYQERILSASYFDSHSKPDLRWNHYLYFLTSGDALLDATIAKAKAAIEVDREYARKVVLTETDLVDILEGRVREQYKTSLPPDPLTEWSKTLEKHDLGFVIDEALQVPAVVRHIAKGERQGLRRPPAAPELTDAERRVADDRLGTLKIKQFRRYPLRKDYDFGVVNLVVGVNGVGKTSLLEAIEYLFCGRVRRSDGAPPKAWVSGVLAKSGLELETKSTTPAAKLRARHLVWYGKADVRATRLDDSFGKFNFLDTDAAARLTVEQSQERINADLAQLLLGNEAAKALERFERLSKALLETKRDLERDVQIRDQRRLDAAARLQELRTGPQESDQLLRQLTSMLDAVGWITTPSDKHDTEHITSGVQSALVSVGVLKAAGAGVPRDHKALTAMRAQLSRGAAAVKTILDRRRQIAQTEAQVSQTVRTVDARAAAVARLLPMLDAGLTEIARDVDERKKRVATLGAALGKAEPAARAVAELEVLGGATVRRALENYEHHVEERAKYLDIARRSLDVFEHAQAVLTNLAQQLRSVARQIVDHTHDEAHCPLCATPFKRADLQARLSEGAQSIAGEEAQRIRQQVREAELAHQQAAAVLQALRTLNEYQATIGSRTTVRALLTRVAADRAELLKLQTELDALRQEILEHEKKGQTLARLATAAQEAGILPSDVDRASVEGLSDALAKQRAQHFDALAKTREDRQKADEDLNGIAREMGLTGIDGDQLLVDMLERTSVADQVARAIDALAERMKLDSLRPDLELEAQLREAHEAATRVGTAVAREQSVNESITKELRVVEDSTAEVAALRVQVGRIDSAINVIGDLVQKQSGQALTNQVLRENGSQIAATFGRIHAPSEFDVAVDEDGLKITRRATNASVDLNEMSSGQRAAFTLSLFLAMNGRLRTGPTAIIFDDPVAHVDDINTLSFMDHLREVALEGERQIFFATADSKLAGLFARKFRFLGSQFKHIELQRE